MRRTVGRIYVGLLVACAICLLGSVVCLAEHKEPRNAYERWVVAPSDYWLRDNPTCEKKGKALNTPGYHIGMTWLAPSPGDPYGFGWNGEIDIKSDEPKQVYITGSQYKCGVNNYPGSMTDFQETDGKNYLINIEGGPCFRGDPMYPGYFSDPACAKGATLNTSNIIRDCGDKEECLIFIGIYRCYNGANCAGSNLPVRFHIYNWQISVKASVSQPEATPGDIVDFVFSGHQDGPANTNKVVNFYGKVDGSTGRHLATWPKGTPSGTTGGPWVERRYITQQDVGKRVCGTIAAQPSSLRSDAPVSDTACVEVPYNWHSELSTKAKSDSHWNESKGYDINHGGMYPNVYPKDKLTWWHQANFIGPTRAQQDVSFFSHSTLAGHGSDPIGYKNQYWGYGNGSYGIDPLRVFNFEGARGQMNSYEVEQDDVTHDICEYFSAHPGYGYGMPWGLREGDTRSNKVCFHVPYHYIPEPPGHGPTPKDCLFYGNCPGHDIPGGKLPGGLLVSTNSNRMTKDRVLLGDPVAFDSVIKHNGGRTKSKPYRYESYAAIIRGSAIDDYKKRGPLIYSGNGFNNPEFNCTIKGKPDGKVHRVKRGDIKYCFTVCNNTRGGSGSCATDMPSLGLNRENKDKSYNDQFDVSMFNAARPDPGDKICYWAAITNWAAIDDDSAKSTLVSNMTCIDIAKQPQLKIVGGDTIAGGSIRGSSYNTVNPINNDRGSWSQYGLFANGEINDFGSAGFSTAYIANILNSCRLDYANKIGLSTGGCDINKMGHFGAKSDGYSKYVPHVPDIDHSKFEDVYSDTIDLSRFEPYKQRAINYLGVSTLRITGNLPRGARVVIDAVKGAQIDIVGNITASEGRGYERLSDIPSLTVLTDNNINIARNVTELFGNYISRKGKIYTCADSKADSDSDAAESDKLGVISVCNQKLRVRGALISAGDIVFHRTYGSDNFNEKTRSLPSEEIDYTPNTFLLPLSNLTTVNDSITYRIVNANMLAPRF